MMPPKNRRGPRHEPRAKPVTFTGAKLKKATQAAVRAEIATLMKRELSEADVAHMVSSVGPAKHWGELEADELLLRTEYDAAAAGRLLVALRTLASPHFAELARLANRPDVVRLAEELMYFERTAATWSKRSPRVIIADPLKFKGRMFWWRENPTNRDRALLSLLAGNFPDVEGEALTAEAVIQKEADTIGAQIRRRRATRRDLP